MVKPKEHNFMHTVPFGVFNQPFSRRASIFTDNNQLVSFLYRQFKLSISRKVAFSFSNPTTTFISWFQLTKKIKKTDDYYIKKIIVTIYLISNNNMLSFTNTTLSSRSSTLLRIYQQSTVNSG